MKIKELFARDIHRSINGVVKADQLDRDSIWQELDEFVITRELAKHFNDLIEALLYVIDSTNAPKDRNGVWISGFFGSGKSHLIKVLSYLLENKTHTHKDETKQAADFFPGKFDDAMLLADLKRVVSEPIDTILFNVDAKANQSQDNGALLSVFLKVLNEKQGYSGDHPHIANTERYLDKQGKLTEFHEAFHRESGKRWVDERDAWAFRRDEVVAALVEVTGQSKESIEKLLDGGDENFDLTVENFAQWVRQYLDDQGPDQKIMFLVDEVGQFVGNDAKLMLNLQTITEQLGTVCEGRAWVVVTSQEDLDAVLGDLGSAKQHDFSKIQGRFKTRLSLSSANVDEVIKKRLLEKKPEAEKPLLQAYDGKHDILKHQLSFVNAGMSFKTYGSAEEFAACYPFPAYQFSLVQKVFESIRKAGATGVHISRGERSTLDAFQGAAKKVGDEALGALVPFRDFYPAVEGFLDTTVKATISQASDNHDLEPFDAELLKVLFLIRYIDELPGSVDNLVTLSIDRIDADKMALRGEVESSLGRLEAQTLVARNGDLYQFLTNEERDIGREIKNSEIPSGAEERELGKVIFEDLLGDVKKHTFSETKRDFRFNRICDDHPVGSKHDGSLEISVVSPLSDSYSQYREDAFCIMQTAGSDERVLVRIPDDAALGREIRTYIQTEEYVKKKQTGSLAETTKRILRDRSNDNQARRRRILAKLTELLASSAYFASGQPLPINSDDPKVAVGEALEYVIKNAYPKMSYIERFHPNPNPEIQSTLRANDIAQVSLNLEKPEANPKALNEMRDYLRLCNVTSKRVVLHELVHNRFGGIPYGWPEGDVLLLLARLAVLKEISLIVNAAPLPLDQAYDHLTSTSKQRKVIVTLKESADNNLLKEALAIGKELFAEQGPAGEDALHEFLRTKLERWDSDLKGFEPLAATGQYPGSEKIENALAVLRKFVKETDSLRFLRRIVDCRDELKAVADDAQELRGFYKNQRHSWEKLRDALDALELNNRQLESDEVAGPAVARMKEIRKDPSPYDKIREVADLIHTTTAVNNKLVSKARSAALPDIEKLRERVENELTKMKAGSELKDAASRGLAKCVEVVNSTTSIAHIAEAGRAADDAYSLALDMIEKSQAASSAPILKKRRTVVVRSLWSGDFIESHEEIDSLISELRTALESAVDAGERVEIK